MPEINVWAEDPALGVVTNDVTISAEIQTATAGQTLFTLADFTVTDSKALAVFRNGVREYEGATLSWTLSAPTQVQFTEGLEAGDVVQFVLNQIEADPTVDVTATDVAATVYTVDNISLQKHLDATSLADVAALRAITGVTHGNIARILGGEFPLLYRWDAIASSTDDGIAVITPTSISGAGRWILWTPPFIDAIEELFSSGAPIASRLIALGDVTLADGNGGIYYWNPATARSTANGTTIVDPTVSRANQGTGAGVGCYLRVTSFV